jgi:ATP-dependent DNA helicase RecG
MYQLSDSVVKIRGVGRKTEETLAKQEIKTVKDFLLYLPLRYEDRSQMGTISQLEFGQTKTIKAKVVKVNEYFKNRKRITSAVISDKTGRTKCIWFNNRYIKHKLKPDKTFFFSGKYTKYRTITQPTVEALKADTIHTGRLVPLYSTSLDIAQGTLRRLLKETVDNLEETKDEVAQKTKLLPLSQALKQLHFPEEKSKVRKSRERLALEELLGLIKQSEQIKQSWEQGKPAIKLGLDTEDITSLIPEQIPFNLTEDQKEATQEILTDLSSKIPMNRLLIGDVGSGKTVVAGIACHHILKQDQPACLVAPTQILAKQHYQTFQKIFPQIETELLTADNKPEQIDDQSKLFIGTHAVINQIKKINPALIIYDEQHRFGVKQRSAGLELKTKSDHRPHVLTMTATPIPRSYMLTVFSHLKASIITQMPFGQKPTETWLVPDRKRSAAYHWVAEQLKSAKQTSKNSSLALVVCPFIEDSDHEAFADIPSATSVFDNLQQKFKGSNLNLDLLHGQMKSDQKQDIIRQLFKDQIDLLVTTSIVEVGVDLPNANIMVIEGAGRFGLASLHQLRGRVGRQGQNSYCLLFSQSDSDDTKQRLDSFTQIHDGLKLAQLDLQNRGGGDLFGMKQHGFDDLRFASWSNLDLIKQAREVHHLIKDQQINWQSLFSSSSNKNLPAAN